MLFTPDEIEKIMSDIKKNDIKNAKLEAEYALLEKQWEQAMSRALKTNRFNEVDMITKQMSEINSQIVY